MGAATAVVLAIYDVRGRRVRTLAQGQQEPGTHPVRWDGRDAQGEPVAPGVYVSRLLVDGVPVATRRVVRLPE